MNLAYFVEITKRDHPDWPLTAVYWQARRMQERHPKIEKAYHAGLNKGRELRERMEHGLGIWWDELGPLLPEERTFVLALVKNEIQPKKAKLALVPLEQVHETQKNEAWEQEQDALAADWREKSAQPDKRVTKVAKIRDLLKPKGAA